MWRLFHIVAIGALVGSAVYAYTIKYETILYAEKVVKIKHKIAEAHDKIAMLRADWAHLARPERLQALVAANLDLQPLALTQIVRVSDIPLRAPHVDSIGKTLDALTTSSIRPPNHTPRAGKPSGGATPAAR